MMALDSFEEIHISLSFLRHTNTILKLKDIGGPFARFWVYFGIFYATIALIIRAICCYRGECNLADTICPKRRARYIYCARRAARRCKRDSHDDSCCLKRFLKLHLPPPLPLSSRRQRCEVASCCTTPEHAAIKEDIVEDSSSDSQEESTLASCPSNTSTLAGVTTAALTLVSRRTKALRTPLIDLVRMQQWPAVLEQASRREAKHRDVDGLYPLHWACSGGPPIEVIQALLHHYPSAVRKVDTEGSTPLHFAAHYSASYEVIDTLLKACPRAINELDKHGRSPLYHAVDKSAGLEVVELLARTDPSMITNPCLPARIREATVINLLDRKITVRTALFAAWAAVISDVRARTTRRGKVWKKAMLLLELAHMHEKRSQVTFLPLHAAIELDNYLPDKVIPLLLSSYPDHATKVDDQGLSPLALAMAKQQYSSERSDTLVQLLLVSSQGLVCDPAGRSPLAHAASSGKPWNAGMERLIRACPEALYHRDPSSGLFPALLLAAAKPAVPDMVVQDDTLLVTSLDPYGLVSPKEKDQWLAQLSSPKPASTREIVTRESTELSTLFQLVLANPAAIGVASRSG